MYLHEEDQYQMVWIEQPFGAPPPRFFCPICGRPAISFKEEEGLADLNPCLHVAFLYDQETQEFVYVSDLFRERVEQGFDWDADWRLEQVLEIVEDGDFGNDFLIMAITCSGMGGGPESFTSIIAYDFSTIQEKG
ncbi:MAG: hypothetical protein D6820_13080 [Lentisphaerae bacterium]|nr:MAG: hypothetical protein D6820_13080 [Lentisphaerota bacterium]